MTMHDTQRPVLWIRSSTELRLRALMAAFATAGGCLAVALGAQLRIPVPYSDVPYTLQTLAVLLVGFAISPGRAVAALMLYLMCGAAGLPVFTAGSAGLAGATGGYLVGFLAAVWLVSSLKGGRDAGYGRLAAAGAVGMAAVFVAGVAWRITLALWTGFYAGDVVLAAGTGFLPFLLKSAVEVSVAAAAVMAVRGTWRSCAEKEEG